MKYEIYQGKNNQWYWRLKAANGQIIAIGGEGYVNKADAKHGIELVKSSSLAPVVEVDW